MKVANMFQKQVNKDTKPKEPASTIKPTTDPPPMTQKADEQEDKNG